MYNKIENWLDEALSKSSDENAAAVVFNLYEDEPNAEWSLELVGTESFKMSDDEWACDEVTDFGTRETPFSWHEDAHYSEIFLKISDILLKYLENGKYGSKLKNYTAIGIGFVDGDLDLLYLKDE